MDTRTQGYVCHVYKHSRVKIKSVKIKNIYITHSIKNEFLSGFPGGSDGKVSVYNAGDPGLIPGLGRSPGEGNGSPLQDYCLENPMDRGAW